MIGHLRFLLGKCPAGQCPTVINSSALLQHSPMVVTELLITHSNLSVLGQSEVFFKHRFLQEIIDCVYIQYVTDYPEFIHALFVSSQ